MLAWLTGAASSFIGGSTMRILNSKVTWLGFGVGLAIAASTIAASAGNVDLSDGTFSSVTNVGGSGTVPPIPSGGFFPTGDGVSATVCGICGDSGAALKTVISNTSYNPAPNPVLSGGIAVFDNALTYDPATQGSVILFDASADKSNNSSSGNSFQILIEQAGNYYVDTVTESTGSGFLAFNVNGLTASDFSQICLVNCGPGNYANASNFNLSGDTAVALNLVNGGTIEFGVLFTAHPTIGQTNTQIYDNLDFNLSTTPLPSTWTMLIAGFLGLGLFAYRGSRKGVAALSAA
jgi:hypothetical protein